MAEETESIKFEKRRFAIQIALKKYPQEQAGLYNNQRPREFKDVDELLELARKIEKYLNEG